MNETAQQMLTWSTAANQNCGSGWTKINTQRIWLVWNHVTRNKTFIAHLAGLVCFNVVHSDDAIVLEVRLVHYTTESAIASSECTHIKHLKSAKCVINITYTFSKFVYYRSVHAVCIIYIIYYNKWYVYNCWIYYAALDYVASYFQGFQLALGACC